MTAKEVVLAPTTFLDHDAVKMWRREMILYIAQQSSRHVSSKLYQLLCISLQSTPDEEILRADVFLHWLWRVVEKADAVTSGVLYDWLFSLFLREPAKYGPLLIRGQESLPRHLWHGVIA